MLLFCVFSVSCSGLGNLLGILVLRHYAFSLLVCPTTYTLLSCHFPIEILILITKIGLFLSITPITSKEIRRMLYIQTIMRFICTISIKIRDKVTLNTRSEAITHPNFLIFLL